jgi:uroporphyrinogen III methyltransferase/synthase
LADFGAARRAELLDGGLPVTRPSERKPSSRKKVRTQ